MTSRSTKAGASPWVRLMSRDSLDRRERRRLLNRGVGEQAPALVPARLAGADDAVLGDLGLVPAHLGHNLERQRQPPAQRVLALLSQTPTQVIPEQLLFGDVGLKAEPRHTGIVLHEQLH